MQLNDGLTAKAHTDRNCFGMSLIMTLGPFTGGEVWHTGTNQTGSGVWDTTETMLEFNGKITHGSMPCYGRKFTVVVYTNSSIAHVEAGNAIHMAAMHGLPMPDPTAVALCMEAQDPVPAVSTAHIPALIGNFMSELNHAVDNTTVPLLHPEQVTLSQAQHQDPSS